MKGKASKKVKKAAKPAKKAALKTKASKPAKKAIKKISKPAKKAAKPAAKKKTAKSHKPKVVKKARPKVAASHKHSPKVHRIKLKSKKADKRLRYSDTELKEFKKLIVEKLDKAKTELKYYQEQITRSADNSTDDTENRFGSPEDGTATMEREFLTQQAGRQYQYIEHLENALIRIENKTYGICRVTGKLIDKDRLRAVPHATMSIEAKLKQTKSAQPVVVINATAEESAPAEDND